MVQQSPDIISDRAPVQDSTREVDDVLALLALDAELDQGLEDASSEAKARLADDLRRAAQPEGGRGYDFNTVTAGIASRRELGGSAIAGAFGRGQYGMPVVRTRRDITNAYIHRNTIRY